MIPVPIDCFLSMCLRKSLLYGDVNNAYQPIFVTGARKNTKKYAKRSIE